MAAIAVGRMAAAAVAALALSGNALNAGLNQNLIAKMMMNDINT